MRCVLVLSVLYACNGNAVHPSGLTGIDGVAGSTDDTSGGTGRADLTGAVLVFSSQPTGGVVGVAMPSVRVSVQELDGSPRAAAGVSVTLAAVPGTLTGVLDALTDASGSADFSLLVAPTVAGVHHLTAFALGASGITSVDFVLTPGAADATQSTIDSSRLLVVADGVDSAHIDVILRDQYGNVLPPSSVTVDVSGQGQVTFDTGVGYDLTSTAAGTITLALSVGGQTLGKDVIFTAVAVPDATQSTFVASASTLNADDQATASLTFLARDPGGNPISGVLVTFGVDTTGGDTTLSGPTCTTDVTGACAVTIRASADQRRLVTASAGSVSKIVTLTFSGAWQRVSRAYGVFSKLLPVSGALMYGTDSLTVFRTSDGAVSFDDIGVNLPGTRGTIGGLAPGATASVLYAILQSGGVFRSTNADALDPLGVRWTHVYSVFPIDIAAIGNDVFVAVGGSGVLKSTDGGDSFAEIPGYPGGYASLVEADSTSPGSVVVGTQGAGVLRYDGAWSALANGPSNTNLLVVDPNGLVYATDFASSATLYRATGATFAAVSTPMNTYDLVVDSSGRVYTDSSNGSQTSADGTSFNAFNSGHTISQHNAYASYYGWGAVGSTVYASTDEGLVATTGSTWASYPGVRGYISGRSATMAVGASGTHLFVATQERGDIFYSADDGATWSLPAAFPLSARVGFVNLLWSDPGSPDTVSVGTELAGAYVLSGATLTANNVGATTANVTGFALMGATGWLSSLNMGARYLQAGTWTDGNSNLSPSTQATSIVAATIDAAGALALGTAPSGAFYLSGAAWVQAGGIAANGDAKLFTSSANPESIVYAAVATQGIFKSVDGGKSYAATASTTGSYSSLAVKPGGQVVWATKSYDLAPIMTLDGGSSWVPIPMPGMRDYALGLFYARANTVFFTGGGGGVYRNDTDGQFP